MDGRITAVQEAQVKIKLSAEGMEGEGRWFPFSTVYSSPDGSGWYCMPEEGDEIRLYFPTVKEKHAYVISAVHLPVEEGKVKAATASSGSTGSYSGGGGGGSTGGYSSGGGGSTGGYSSGTGVSYMSQVEGRADVSTSLPQPMEGQTGANQEGFRSDPRNKVIRTDTGKELKLTPTQIYLSNGKGLEILLDDEQGIIINSNQMINICSEEAISISGQMGIDLMGTEMVQLKHKKSRVTLREEQVMIEGAEVHMQ